MKLNLGCGFRKKEGFINVDIAEGCMPDLQVDLAVQKWPWDDNSAQEIHFDFSLEQMGENKKDLFHIFKELYRVSAPEAVIKLTFIHPRHDQFALNPLCVHRLSPEFFSLMSLANNLSNIANGSLDTNVALALGVNFQVVRHKYLVTEMMGQLLESGQMSEEDLRARMSFENNICHAMEVDLSVIKIVNG